MSDFIISKKDIDINKMSFTLADLFAVNKDKITELDTLTFEITSKQDLDHMDSDEVNVTSNFSKLKLNMANEKDIAQLQSYTITTSSFAHINFAITYVDGGSWSNADPVTKNFTITFGMNSIHNKYKEKLDKQKSDSKYRLERKSKTIKNLENQAEEKNKEVAKWQDKFAQKEIELTKAQKTITEQKTKITQHYIDILHKIAVSENSVKDSYQKSFQEAKEKISKLLTNNENISMPELEGKLKNVAEQKIAEKALNEVDQLFASNKQEFYNNTMASTNNTLLEISNFIKNNHSAFNNYINRFFVKKYGKSAYIDHLVRKADDKNYDLPIEVGHGDLEHALRILYMESILMKNLYKNYKKIETNRYSHLTLNLTNNLYNSDFNSKRYFASKRNSIDNSQKIYCLESKHISLDKETALNQFITVPNNTIEITIYDYIITYDNTGYKGYSYDYSNTFLFKKNTTDRQYHNINRQSWDEGGLTLKPGYQGARDLMMVSAKLDNGKYTMPVFLHITSIKK